VQLVGIQIYNLDIARIKNQRNEIHYHVYKIPWLDFMMSKLNLTLILKSYFLDIHSNIILLFMPMSPKLFHCISWLKFYNHFCYFSLLCWCHTFPNILRLITLYLVSYKHFGSLCQALFSSPLFFLSLNFKYPHQHTFLNTLNLYSKLKLKF